MKGFNSHRAPSERPSRPNPNPSCLFATTHRILTVLLYMVCHGSHQYTPVMLAYIYQHHGSVMGNSSLWQLLEHVGTCWNMLELFPCRQLPTHIPAAWRHSSPFCIPCVAQLSSPFCSLSLGTRWSRYHVDWSAADPRCDAFGPCHNL